MLFATVQDLCEDGVFIGVFLLADYKITIAVNKNIKSYEKERYKRPLVENFVQITRV